MTDRPSLRSDGLDEVWARVRTRLETHGTDNRGRVSLPELSSSARLTLTSLLGRPPGKTVDLRALETALVRLDLGPDLAAALGRLGQPVSDQQARRRAERAEAAGVRDLVRRKVADWPEPWAPGWIDEVVRTGALRPMDANAATRFVGNLRAVLDQLDLRGAAHDHAADSASRIDLAARILGSAHALDVGSRLEAALTRAIAWSEGLNEADRADAMSRRELWERAGIHLDLTSAPVLTWALPLEERSPLAALAGSATGLGVPLHLSQYALRRHPSAVAPGARILVVENPRLVEAAAQVASPVAVVATNGNPSGAVRLLIDQLLAGGADLAYHGDFDAAGLAICARMADLELPPWRMATQDYIEALAQAETEGVELPVDPTPPGPTPWDPELRPTFDQDRRIVHEERLLPHLLQQFAADARAAH